MKNSLPKLKRQRGITITEFTLVAVVFMFMLFSIIEGARYVYTNGAISHLAREGARYASVRGEQAGKDVLRSSDAPATQTTISSYISGQSPISDITTTVSWSPNNTPGSEVSVTITHTFSSIVTLFNDVELTSTATNTIYF
ncbi:hypothetical protein GTG28_00115 [Vibrio sp. OCN044]|uniref:TadE-like domain-containing protein n=1 Tax=Vibrio tetraodonis subsp. pristinus TaxID=2695891 RepID=A0A6L8LNN5_9VIBR|nr:TadE/TadG family type IV pilus assembly protein [Vibrio tetraodonis]MYM57637.1 hypothetical protein [Vibrio tetraodonis subsp. pristinus]